MKRIAAGAASGWGLIVLLSWSLAQRRIGICGASGYDASDIACRMRATAARDAVLTHGLSVLLVGAVVFVLLQGGWLKGLGSLRNASPVTREPLLDAPAGGTGRRAWADRFQRPLGMRWPAQGWRRLALIAIVTGAAAYIAFGIATASWPGIGAGPAPIATETAAEATDAPVEAIPYAAGQADPAPPAAQAEPGAKAGESLPDEADDAAADNSADAPIFRDYLNPTPSPDSGNSE